MFVKHSPVLFISVPLGLLLALYTLNAFSDPSTIMRGLWLKGVIIGSLIYALRMMILTERYKNESDYLNRQ
ncbi:MAG TPA: hypothetical protein VFE50_05470 [Cyclobacteriaceae bacterium]|nr:hypothetical protein [Cyclobacteriaceae bacterium]